MGTRALPDLPELSYDFSTVRAHFLDDEVVRVGQLLPYVQTDVVADQRIQQLAEALIRHARLTPHALFADFLRTFRLSTQEGRILLTLAEALLRIPDKGSADRLINALLSEGNWVSRTREGPALVQWATRGLALARRFVADNSDMWHRLMQRMGDAVFRRALTMAVQMLASQFVQGETMEAALAARKPGLRYSFDCLGEAAQTNEDADNYFYAYRQAILALGGQGADTPLLARDGISIKLSALHPRFELAQWSSLERTLRPRLLELAQAAAEAGISLTIDAEEAERLEITLSLWADTLHHPTLRGWNGLGLVVQAYQKRAPAVIDWIAAEAARADQRVPVRLVKGAYWDSEIKRAQQQGLSDYPVYTRKVHTDIAYLACAEQLLRKPEVFYAQFATHNAHTLAWLHEAGLRLNNSDFEVQRLAGMGEPIHAAFQEKTLHPVRVYAPVGGFRTLLPYLVRRLLENGSSQSFVNQLADPAVGVDELTRPPLARLATLDAATAPSLPRPAELFLPRANSPGISPADINAWSTLRTAMQGFEEFRWHATPLLGSVGSSWARTATGSRRRRAVTSPADTSYQLGEVDQCAVHEVSLAYQAAEAAFPIWSRLPVTDRTAVLRQLAEGLQAQQAELVYLLVHEAGKTLPAALAEWRETVDYCHYYAEQAEKMQAEALPLPGITGEANTLGWHARGVFLCISPWNFPLAILAGQVLAALVVGNTVVAKPASQTPLIAHRFVQLLLEAGLPPTALQLVLGSSHDLAGSLLDHSALAGVAFTGASATARQIARRLAEREGPLLPLIAETGGLNAMIADSSALPEQVVTDVVVAAFDSAGQRCSALRILWLQEDIRESFLKRLQGAMDLLKVDHPGRLATDVGPVIDAPSQRQLASYCEALASKALWQADAPLGMGSHAGHYLSPRAFLLPPELLPREEVFGPVLHIATFASDELPAVVERINATGFGLTLGVHSRIDSTLKYVGEHARVGNIYCNRNQIGAVPGSQPFGGEGLSGTGFKAGGPHYLMRFCTERVICNNLSALGVNTSLLGLV